MDGGETLGHEAQAGSLRCCDPLAVIRREQSGTENDAGEHQSEHDITDAADVQEVLRWAEENAGERIFTVYVVVDRTLVRLSGENPTAAI